MLWSMLSSKKESKILEHIPNDSVEIDSKNEKKQDKLENFVNPIYGLRKSLREYSSNNKLTLKGLNIAMHDH